MQGEDRKCPQCESLLIAVWPYGDIEMGRCPKCGEIPLATVYYGPMNAIECETEFEVFVIHDGTDDFYLRLSRLVPELNVIQLKKLEMTSDDQTIVPLGIRTNTIDSPRFMKLVSDHRLNVNLKPVT